MSDLDLLLIGLLARGVVFALVGTLLCLAFRRQGPVAGAGIALASLTGLVVVSAFALSPWPRWWTLSAPAPAAAPAPAPIAVPTSSVAGNPHVTPPTPIDVSPSLPTVLEAGPARLPETSRGVDITPLAVSRAAVGWPSWIAAAFALGAIGGLIHLGIGLAGVASLRRCARPIADAPILDEIDVLRAELGCAGRVDVLESGAMATPATVGWLRPALLLPADWKTWEERERRAILVHELAHVRQGDYLAGLWARLCLCLSFYNPLAHWLARRMWVQQELAADAWAAALSGGSRPYLATLARMALRCDERPAGWPTRAFLPTGTAFLRRIQMLRDSQDVRPAAFPARARALTLAVLIGAGLALGGLRGPDEPARAQEPGQAAAPAAGEFRLDLVPREAGLVIAIRPAELLARPELASIKELIAPREKAPHSLNMAPGDIDQATLVGLTRSGPELRRKRPFDLVILRAKGPQDWKAVVGTFISKSTEVPFAGKSYLRATVAPVGECYAILDDRTIVTGQEGDLQLLLTDLTRPRTPRAWDDAWKRVAKGQVAVAVETPWLIERFMPAPGQPAGAPSVLTTFGPLFDKAYAYAIGVDALAGLKVDALASCSSDPGAEKVAETLGALKTLATNMLASSKAHVEGVNPQARPAAQVLLDQAVTLLDKARVVRDGRSVSVRAQSDLKLAEVAKTFVPVLTRAQGEKQRFQSVNNMKQLALAFHNYASVHQKFPPAVLLGPDGKTPHSWRVAILPYIDQESLYKRYKLDEPWDGPNNIKLVDQMPAAYSASGASGAPGVASYFALTGPDTIFADTKGTGFSQITDGTSNTILLVEAKRDIPWTKPEDIPYDPKAPLPELGGYFENGFNAALGDGSIRFLKSTLNPNTLRALITKAGGEVVPAD